MADTTITLELSLLEANQLEAALSERLAQAAKAEQRFDAASLEADMVAHEIRYTGSGLTKLQLALYGPDEPDEPVWLRDRSPLAGWTEGELREAFSA